MNWPTNESNLAMFIASQVAKKASGRCYDECKRNQPRDVYFLGNLRPVAAPSQERSGISRDLLNKISPSAFGAEFKLALSSTNTASVNVEVRWSCYYRVFPTFGEQRDHQQQVTWTQRPGKRVRAQTPRLSGEDEEELGEEDEDDYRGSITYSTTVADRDSLMVKFRKITCAAKERIIIGLNREPVYLDVLALKTALDNECSRAVRSALQDPERIRTFKDSSERIKVPSTALKTKEEYENFCRSLTSEVVPQWAWGVIPTAVPSSPERNELVVSLEFVNQSAGDLKSPNVEPFLFDGRVRLEFCGCSVVPFQIDLSPKDFRYDREVIGRGFNCGIERITDSVFATSQLPVHQQLRYETRDKPEALFRALSTDPTPVLDEILRSMWQYHDVTWAEVRAGHVRQDSSWEGRHGAQYDQEREKFRQEILRFSRGLELIRSNADVALAFRLTNQTFLRGSKTSWRLFQAVFLVAQIPGIAALQTGNTTDLADRECVDIVYFPTGGGKTEAYLGVMVFHCFFDRLRGKTAGVTAWTRFPLRLLTLQQTQRIADSIGLAELVRREQTDPRLVGETIDGFAVGYFVGAEATPNELTTTRGDSRKEADWSKANDDKTRSLWKRVTTCPSCRTQTVRVDLDLETVSIIHRCTNGGCAFPDGKIPVFIIDNEIYRRLPSIVVGTIDKLAGVGNQRKVAMVFGNVDGRCMRHGYYKGKCCQKECSDKGLLRAGKPQGISGPTLFIQDELHLIREGLGTFDSHYETFAQRLLAQFGANAPLKIIASSATIEAFERQVAHLYGRGSELARVFPGPGPSARESFYATTLEHPQRIYVGLLPHNKTIFNAMLELLQMYHETIQDLQRLPAGSTVPFRCSVLPGSTDWQSLLDCYQTSLTYFLSGRDLASIKTDLDSAVRTDMERGRYVFPELMELTGDTSSDDVTKNLAYLERTLPPDNPPTSILATSMISHGVDVNRLNAMFFYGMPRQNAEYIQASSRVGRSHVGLVFMCHYPARERDQSHFSYFKKYHEFLGQLVEPVAINRWSKFSINRTLPGLFMGVLLQVLANRGGSENPDRYYMLDHLRTEISQGTITAGDFVPFLEDAYLVNSSTEPGAVAFSQEIHRMVGLFLDQITVAPSGGGLVSDVLVPPAMNNLREVDEQIEITLDEKGRVWAGLRTRGHSK